MKIKSRKQARKEFRKSKKKKKHDFFSRKKSKAKTNDNLKKKNSNPLESSKNFHISLNSNKKSNEKSTIETNKKLNKKKKKQSSFNPTFKSSQDKWEFERQKEKEALEKLQRDIKTSKLKMLKFDNLKEDIEIKKLEKQLKINKKPSKAFTLDGLDYILDVCHKKISENEYEKILENSDSEFENDFENIVGKPKEINSKSSKIKNSVVKTKVSKNKEIKSDSDSDSEKNEFNNNLNHKTDDDFDDVEFDDDNSISNSDMDDDCDSYVDHKFRNLSPNVSSMQDCKQKMKGYFPSDKQQEKYDEFSLESSELEKEKKHDKANKKHFNKKQVQEEMENKNNNKTSESDIDKTKEMRPLEQLKSKNKSQKEQKLWEDIYGRTRDEQGNVVECYVPPQLRHKMGPLENEKKNENLLRLKKQIKGLLNRLSESNMNYISNQIEQLYMSNSRNHMNEILFTLFQDSLFAEILTPERLIADYAMLIAVLHSNIGSEIGAHFLQHSVNLFCHKLENNTEVENKEINNIFIFIMQLYNFQIFHSKLMYDLIYILLKKLEEKQIELLLTSLRIVGFNLRKDDPAALKNLILEVQKQVNGISTPELSSRVKFMLDMLMAIKNNNMSKIPNYDPEFVEKLRKSLKLLVRKGNYNTELNISLQDILNAEKHGRWWIIGSAWVGGTPGQLDSTKPKETESLISNEFSQKLLDLAKQQRMNTDIRRNIFCILMSAEDFLDAFEKLIKLKLKGTVEREIMNVLLHCALQERNFNPYYVYVANKFCTFDRKYQIMLQCALWDKIKELENLLPIQITNLAKFVGTVILERGLPISVLKVIQFSDLNKRSIKFMRQVLLRILCHEDQNSITAVFKRIANSTQLKSFRESLALFLQHFVVLKSTKNIEKEKVANLVDKVKIAEEALLYSDVSMVF